MFENLSERLGKTVKNLRGQGRLSEQNIKDALREVRMALLEADVALPVVKQFIACLLYTSPSPRDGLLSRMPSSA